MMTRDIYFKFSQNLSKIDLLCFLK